MYAVFTPLELLLNFPQTFSKHKPAHGPAPHPWSVESRAGTADSIAHLSHTVQQHSLHQVQPMLVYKYVDQKGLAAMLVIKSSAGVAPEVILRNPFHEGDEAGKQGIHYDFESQGRQHQKSTTGVSVAPLKGLMPSI